MMKNNFDYLDLLIEHVLQVKEYGMCFIPNLKFLGQVQVFFNF